jgi:uncharacterized SAM-binding protein YcdF (DUF218 family)
MSFFIAKMLSTFIYPLGAVLLIGATSLALSLTACRRTGQLLLGCVLAALWISATPAFANWLSWRVAWQAPQFSPEKLPQSHAVVLLGGTPASRILHALQLYRAGKARLIVVTGGNPPGHKAVVPEALRVADLLVGLGVPRSALVLETSSRNTRENAVNTAAIFKEQGWQHGLLVTERLHMPRAFLAFQKVGLDMTPAATDSASGLPEINSVLDFLPDVGALAWTTAAVKEMLALAVYRFRGWA